MSENAEIQAKIDAVTGKINLHKQQQQQSPQHGYSQRYSPQPYQGYGRWTPYGRGGRHGYIPPVRNRTLILNGKSPSPAKEPMGFTETTGTPSPAALVSISSTNRTVMTKETYQREQQQRGEDEEQKRAAKRRKRSVIEQSRILRHLDSSTDYIGREMVIDGLRFQLNAQGSKLTRVSDPGSSAKETPRRTKIAGVDFHRTKNGNLIRASALADPARPAPLRPQCENFTKHGTCPYGPICRFTHDPNKVAICKDFLKAGTCALGDSCDMSHEMTYHRVPACQYFLRGNCTNDACRYPHVFVSPAAPVCRAFATLGFCVKGPDCDKRHVHECPDYANNGFCANRENGKCLLPHPDRASILRKAAERQAKISVDAESDISSEAGGDHDNGEMQDVDSDAEDVFMTGSDENSHELTQQQDFVSLA
ncbi:hypothetical protein BAUCODRAFT_133464 [Baudoinia panamericana UAMH 10762]|uniref:C3H1-type domain-containing protein n=1 Tax=Baudoinia panamericana (strain UAMH 10762) TaxID=717646 RepID=M2MQ46_BAUPA|nr:uncharacterized protein BAUCODRAFT_133464 [Baudoinia panamericana UAMH 10762]EMC93583.1 hypothetical protein BAUCODRAFT_133464 [Baudoinia panamericana UAMH 10762]